MSSPACEGSSTLAYRLLICNFDGMIADSFPWFLSSSNSPFFTRVDEVLAAISF